MNYIDRYPNVGNMYYIQVLIMIYNKCICYTKLYIIYITNYVQE